MVLKLIKRSFLTLGFAVGLLGCDSASELDTQGAAKYKLSGASNISLSGLVVDAYVRDATVYVDINSNGSLDSNEPSAKTDSEGFFNYNTNTDTNYCAVGPSTFCLTMADSYAGKLVRSVGGIVINTGQPFKGQMFLKLPKAGDSLEGIVISPISSATAFMSDEQIEALSSSLNVPEGVDLNKIDPLDFSSETVKTDEEIEIQKARLQFLTKIQNTVEVISAGLSNKDDAALAAINESVFKAIADNIGIFTAPLKQASQLEQDEEHNSINVIFDAAIQHTQASSAVPDAVKAQANILSSATETSDPTLRASLLNNIVALDEHTEVIFEAVNISSSKDADNMLYKTEIIGETINANPTSDAVSATAALIANSVQLTTALSEGDVNFDFLLNLAGSATVAEAEKELASAIVTAKKMSIDSANGIPIFISTANITVDENQTVIQTITATDADNDPISYSIATADQATFTINENTGELTFNTAPDFKAQSKYSLVITATAGTDTVFQTLTINISKINNAPVFTSADTIAIDENQTVIQTITATDADNDSISYSIATADQATFTIDATTGALTLNSAADFETQSSYTLDVSATDGTNVVVQTLTITIVNINEAGQALIDNMSPLQYDVLTATVVDPDGVDLATLSYQWLKDGVAIVDETTAQYTTTLADVGSVFSVSVTYEDNLGGPYTLVSSETVTLVQSNSAPVAVADSFTTDEDTPITIPFADFIANDTDPDGDTIVMHAYGNINNGTLAQATGADSWVFTPAQDVNGTGSFTIFVKDPSGEISSATTTITINAVNDLPIFTSVAVVSVDENQTFVQTVTATDVEDVVTYSISSADQTVFSINATTGDLVFNAVVDYETQSSYELVVSASDGVAVTEQTMTINIQNVNEAPVTVATQEYAYVLNFGGNAMQAINPVDGAIMSSLAVTAPLNITSSRGQGIVYVSSDTANTTGGVYAIDTSTNTIISFIELSSPSLMIMDKSNHNLYVKTVEAGQDRIQRVDVSEVRGGTMQANLVPFDSVNKCNTSSNVSDFTSFDFGKGISSTSLESEFIYVACTSGTNLLGIDTISGNASLNLSSGSTVNNVVLNQDGSVLYRQFNYDGNARIIPYLRESQADQTTSTIESSVSNTNWDMAFSADGSIAYIANNDNLGIANITASTGVVDTGTLQFKTPTTAQNTRDIAISSDNKYIAMPVYGEAKIAFYDTANNVFSLQTVYGTQTTGINTVVGSVVAFEKSYVTTFVTPENTYFAITPSDYFTDGDAGDSLIYSVTGTDASAMNYDAVGNFIMFSSETADFEVPVDSDADNVYSFTITATDSGGLSQSVSIQITVTDVNDVLPTASLSVGAPVVIDGVLGYDYTVSLSHEFDEDVVVTLTGIAALPISAGNLSASTFVSIIDDAYYNIMVVTYGSDPASLISVAVQNTPDVTSNITSFAFTTTTGTDGVYRIGDTVDITATFNEAVTVTGTPTLTVSFDSTSTEANYISGGGSTALLFRFVVDRQMEDIDGFVIPANAISTGNGSVVLTADANNAELVNVSTAFPDRKSYYRIDAVDIYNDTYDDGFGILGQNEYDVLGIVPTIAADLNADGYQDIVFTAGSAGSTVTNGSYIINGRENPISNGNISGVGGAILYSPVDTLIGIGDMDLDGIDDLLIGDSVTSTQGQGKVFSGSGQALLMTVDGVVAGDLAFAPQSVVNIGDENGDGLDDFLVGSHNANGAKGEATIIYGTPDGLYSLTSLSQADVTLTNNSGVADDYFGDQVTGVGDINGDGFDDFLIGESKADDSATDSGTSYLIYGGQSVSSDDISTTTRTKIEFYGENTLDIAAIVSAVGDVNGDGVPDFAIGAPGFNNDSTDPATGTGKAYVIFGQKEGYGVTSANLSDVGGSITGFTITHDEGTAGDRFGINIISAGDINVDGYDDIMIKGGNSVYVVYGKTTASALLTSTISGGSGGFTITDATNPGMGSGDVNGDGVSDFIFSTSGYPGSATNAGAAYVVYGGNKHISNATHVALNGDALTGTASSDVFTGTVGIDSFTLNGGVDVAYGGGGDDNFLLSSDSCLNINDVGFRIDGGEGLDTVSLGDGCYAYLNSINKEHIRRVEIIDLVGTAEVSIDEFFVRFNGKHALFDAASKKKQMLIKGAVSAAITLVGSEWVKGADFVYGGNTYSRYVYGDKMVEIFIDATIGFNQLGYLSKNRAVDASGGLTTSFNLVDETVGYDATNGFAISGDNIALFSLAGTTLSFFSPSFDPTLAANTYSILVTMTNNLGVEVTQTITVTVVDTLAYYTFDKDTISLIKDTLQSGHDGSAVDISFANDSMGKALDFNGTSNFASIANTTSWLPSGSSARSVSLWLNMPTLPTTVTGEIVSVVSWGLEAVNERFSIVLKDNGSSLLELGINIGSSEILSSNYLDLAQWYHVVVSYDENNVFSVYLNGVNVFLTTLTTLNTSSTGDLLFGFSPSENEFYKGLLDEIKIYDRAITSTEVTTLYESGVTAVPVVVSSVTGLNWMAYNLGATQACVNPNATTGVPSNANQCYGYSYQWGRPADGHEVVNYSGLGQSSFPNGATAATGISGSMTPADGLFVRVVGDENGGDWLEALVDDSGGARSLFFSDTGGTGICPAGFRVPTSAELSDEISGFALGLELVSSSLALPMPGVRDEHTGGNITGGDITVDTTNYSALQKFTEESSKGAYWTVDQVSQGISSHLAVTPSVVPSISDGFQSKGFSIRCIEGK